MNENVINLAEKRKQLEEMKSGEELVEAMPNITRDFIYNTIKLLNDNGYDASELETADNMVLLSMLFQANVDRLDGKYNGIYDFFGDMNLMIFGYDADEDDTDE